MVVLHLQAASSRQANSLAIEGHGRVQTVGFPILIILAWVPYHLRARALARERRPVPVWRQACFAAGLVVLEIAVSPPVDTLSDQLLVAHMAEHLLIGDLAALLLVLGLTGPVIAPLLRNPVVARLRVLAHPVVAHRRVGGQLLRLALAVPLSGGAAPQCASRARARHLPRLRHGGVDGAAGAAAQAEWFGNWARLAFIIAVRLVGTVLANILIFGGTVFYPYYRPATRCGTSAPSPTRSAPAG